MNAEKTKPQARLPLSYFISRCEELTRVRAGNRDELRLIRTELELLRRIHRHTLGQRTPRGAVHTRPNPTKYSPADRRELIEILADSSDAIVEKMIAVLDTEFADTRKEIMMSVVNDEAEKIAHEAAESGAVDLAAPATDGNDPTSIPPDVEEALRRAESQLAACQEEPTPPDDPRPAAKEAVPAAATTPDPPPSDTACVADSGTPPQAGAGEPSPADRATERADATPSSQQDDATPEKNAPANQTAETTHAPSVESSEPTPIVASLSADDATKPDDPVASEADQVKNTDQVNQSKTDAVAPAPQETLAPKAEAPDQNPSTNAPQADPPPAATASPPATSVPPSAAVSPSTPEPSQNKSKADFADGEYTPERAEQAVAAIEDGIRKLAHLLRTEVKGQWDQARTAMDSVSGANEQIDGVCQRVREALEQAKHATMEIHAERDEARLFRQETQRAKERAETSAAAAELAADQAVDELRLIHETRLRDSKGSTAESVPSA